MNVSNYKSYVYQIIDMNIFFQQFKLILYDMFYNVLIATSLKENKTVLHQYMVAAAMLLILISSFSLF